MTMNATTTPPAEGTTMMLATTKETPASPPSISSDNTASTIYVDFAPGDPENPMEFSTTKKWVITVCGAAFNGLGGAAGAFLPIGFPSLQHDLNSTRLQDSAALGLFALGYGTIPLVTSAFSEEVGRRPLYIVSVICFALLSMGIGFAQNIQTVMILRFLLGAAGSTGSTMVGGTLADIWTPAQRGWPMAIFAMGAVGGTGLGPALAGYIEQNSHLRWRWIEWICAMFSALYLVAVFFILVETRAGVILTRRARRLRKETGEVRYKARIEETRLTMKQLIWISCTRPMYLLLTEPIVTSVSIWIGFAWGILYGQLESLALVFQTLYNFNSGATGLMFLSIFFGAVFGIGSVFFQEKLYAMYQPKRGPEARLYMLCVAAILFPLGCFIYGWTSYSFVPWIAPFIGFTVFIFAVFIMYLAVFSYLADVYSVYASSAMAGQSLCRNLAGTFFPLFSNQMYTRLTPKWASTLLGCIAVLMAPIPFVLFFWGPKIRARSRVAQTLRDAAEKERLDKEKQTSMKQRESGESSERPKEV